MKLRVRQKVLGSILTGRNVVLGSILRGRNVFLVSQTTGTKALDL